MPETETDMAASGMVEWAESRIAAIRGDYARLLEETVKADDKADNKADNKACDVKDQAARYGVLKAMLGNMSQLMTMQDRARKEGARPAPEFDLAAEVAVARAALGLPPSPK